MCRNRQKNAILYALNSISTLLYSYCGAPHESRINILGCVALIDSCIVFVFVFTILLATMNHLFFITRKYISTLQQEE